MTMSINIDDLVDQYAWVHNHPETKIIHLVLGKPALLDQIKLTEEDFMLWKYQWSEILKKQDRGELKGHFTDSFPTEFRLEHFLIDGTYVSEADLQDFCAEVRRTRILKEVQTKNDLNDIKTILQEELISHKTISSMEAANNYYDYYVDLLERVKNGYIGVKTGHKWIDAEVVFDKGNLVTIAGRPGEGKSSFSLGLAIDMAHNGAKVCFVGLEMSQNENFLRSLSNVNNVPLENLKKHRIDNISPLIDKFVKYTKKNLDFFHPDRCTTQDIDAVAGKYDVIVVDQLSCLVAPEIRGENKSARYGRMTSHLKKIAMYHKNTVILCSQINREGAQEPKLTNLKDSGSIEEDSDIVLFVHRPDKESKDVYVMCAKNRNGKANHSTIYRFEREITKFTQDTLPPIT